MLTNILVRVFFYVIQIILLLIFESKMYMFQQRMLVVIVINASMIFLSVQMNPVFTIVLVNVIIGPYYARLEKKYR